MTIPLIPAQLGHFVGATTLAVSLSLSGAASAQVDLQKSTIVATLRQMNVPVGGKFGQFDAQLAFDPVKPSRSSARITVDMSSYDLGDPNFNKQVQGKDWFDVADYPNATFVSSSVVSAGDGKYSVTGRLTIHGKTQDVIVPVSVTEQDHTRTFDGSLPVHRRRFGIGRGEWVDTRVVADEVVIKFHLVAAK